MCDGSIEAFDIDDLEAVDELVALEAEIAEILAAEDVAHLAEAMTAGTTAGVVVWENARRRRLRGRPGATRGVGEDFHPGDHRIPRG